MQPFRGVDYLLVDSLFNEEELLVRQTARQFVDDRVVPVIRDCFRDARFPTELIPELGRLGFLGANLEGYGCAGMSNVEYGLIMQELERGDSGLRSFVSVQGALVMYPILTYGSEEQKQRWLPRLQSGEAVGCFGLTEPGFGSNPAGMMTTAQRDGRMLGAERRENMDHQRFAGARGGGLGARRRGDSRISGGEGNAGIHDVGHSRQMVDAGVGDFEPGVCDCKIPESDMLPGAKGLKGPLGVPVAGAVRDWLGRDRARRWIVTRRRGSTPSCASSSTTGRWPGTSWCRRNWRG